MRSFLACCLIVLVYNCGEVSSPKTDRFANCLYEAPTAIFSTNHPSIERHQFKIKAASGVEQIVFDSGLELDLIQKGCETAEQIFRFNIPQTLSIQNEEEWIEQAAEYFFFLGTLDKQYLPLYEWGKLMKANASQMVLSQPYEVYEGFLVTIDQSQNKGRTILQVILEETA
ncbi:MAG: hypothetical protein AAF599_21535 [Bacteroidota bacterium]